MSRLNLKEFQRLCAVDGCESIRERLDPVFYRELDRNKPKRDTGTPQSEPQMTELRHQILTLLAEEPETWIDSTEISWRIGRKRKYMSTIFAALRGTGWVECQQGNSGCDPYKYRISASGRKKLKNWYPR